MLVMQLPKLSRWTISPRILLVSGETVRSGGSRRTGSDSSGPSSSIGQPVAIRAAAGAKTSRPSKVMPEGQASPNELAPQVEGAPGGGGLQQVAQETVVGPNGAHCVEAECDTPASGSHPRIDHGHNRGAGGQVGQRLPEKEGALPYVAWGDGVGEIDELGIRRQAQDDGLHLSNIGVGQSVVGQQGDRWPVHRLVRRLYKEGRATSNRPAASARSKAAWYY